MSLLMIYFIWSLLCLFSYIFASAVMEYPSVIVRFKIDITQIFFVSVYHISGSVYHL